MGIISPEIRKTAPIRSVSLMRKVMNFLFDARPHDPPCIYFGSTLGCDLPPVLPPGEVLFAEKVRQSSDVNLIINHFHQEVRPTYSDPELTPFIKILLKRAKSFYLIEKDLDASLKIWHYLYEQNINGDNLRVLNSMNAFAKELASGIPFRDLDTATRIWTASFRLDRIFGHSTDTLKSMCGVGHKLTAEDLPSAERDYESAFKLWGCAANLPGSNTQRKIVRSVVLKHAYRFVCGKEIDDAIKIWQFLYATAKSNREKKLVIKIMVETLPIFFDLIRPKQERDIDSALKIWKALYAFNFSPKEQDYVVRNMLEAATQLSFIDFSKKDWEIPAALKIWEAAFSLSDDPAEVVVAMEKTAMKLADPMPPIGERDVDSAILIWEKLFTFPLPEKKFLAQRLFKLADSLVDLSLPAVKKEVESALKLWKLLYRALPEQKLSVIRNMMHDCNQMTEAGADVLLRDIDCAIAIWKAVFEFNFSDDQNYRVIGTMVKAAKRLAFEKQDWASSQKIKQAAEELRSRLKNV